MRNYQRLILSIATASFLFLSFKDLGFFAWFSLLPFFILVYRSNLKQTILFSFISGLGFFLGVTYWMALLPVKYTWLLLALLLSILFMVFGIAIYYIIHKIKQPYLRMFMIPAVWVLIEYLRSQTLLAFTIGILGYTQHYFLPLMQIVRYTGIYGISLIIVLFNAVIFETIIFSLKNRKVIFKYFIIAFSILAVFITYGILSVNNNLNRVVREKDHSEIKVAVVQANVLFGHKYSEKGIEIIPKPYSSGSYFKEGTELVVFSESALWGFMDENKEFKVWAEEVLKNESFHMLIGQYIHNEDHSEYYNSALLYDDDLVVQGRYDEIHPVPFSQYLPYPRVLKFLGFLDFSNFNLVLGREYNPIIYNGKGSLGVNICYESTIPSIARKIKNNGAEAIILLSDDSSMMDSIAPWNHLIFSKVRAIENGCYMVHCGNSGISAIISPDGNLIEKSELLSSEVLYGSIYLIPEKTFYTRFGDLLILLYFGIVSSLLIAYLVYRKVRERTGHNRSIT
jgi:apolipoprotein N-acyltransferase